ncbi:MAG: hypothetical protein OXU20_32310 [Myxococcales bacterium]|nr:hypothetical protein [Myxococcales bacterium]
MTPTTMGVRAAFTLVGVAALTACHDGLQGELGNGWFEYQCVNDTDTFCSDRGTGFRSRRADFPEFVGVGGRFRMDYEPPLFGSAGQVRTASSERIARRDDHFIVVSAGHGGLFARERSGQVLDVVHLDCRAVANVGVERDGEVRGSVELALGFAASVRVLPVTSNDEVLAGAFSYSFTVDDPDRLTVRSHDGPRVRLVGDAPGRTRLHVNLSGQEFTLEVDVVDRQAPEPTGDSGASQTPATQEPDAQLPITDDDASFAEADEDGGA